MTWPACVIIAILTMGVVGYLQKISANLLSPAALLFWVTVAFLAGAFALFAYLPAQRMPITSAVLLLGLLAGVTNAAGTWCLFRALHLNAPASIAIPFTALYPLVTVVLAVALLHESLSLRQGIGALLAIAGGALLSYERRHFNP
jgi:bacterial/archaeal transporter family protein